MPIATTCPRCNKSYSAPDHLRGKKMRCKNCQEVLVIGGVAAAVEEVPAVPVPPRSSVQRRSQPVPAVVADDEPARPPRRLRDDREAEDEAPRRRTRKSKGKGKGLVIGLVAGGVALVAVVGVVLSFVIFGPGGAVETAGRWPAPLPFHPMAGPIPDETAVTLHIGGVVNEYTREVVDEKLQGLSDGGGRSAATSNKEGERMTVRIAPVRDPQALARRIDFGTVRRVDGRVITVIAHKVEGPPPNADPITRLLFDLRFNKRRRWDALHKLKDTPADPQRRAEVARALEPLLTDPDQGNRNLAAEALAGWGTRDNVPALLLALNNKDSRRNVILALGRIGDERAVEPLAERLTDFFDRGPAAEALKQLGPAVEKAVLKRLTHPDAQVVMTACDILQKVGTRESVPALQEMAAGKDVAGVAGRAQQALRAVLRRVQAATPVPGVAVAGWGQAFDPDGDCTIKAEGKALTISVPATPHDLAVEQEQLNAPRVLQEVEGDFKVQVKVSGALQPAPEASVPGRVAYQSGCLLVWVDDQNYVRLERASLNRGGMVQSMATLELRQVGRLSSTPVVSLADQDTYLKLERQGNVLTASASQDGRQWARVGTATLALPARVRVGVGAINTARQPLTLRFDERQVGR